MHFFSWENFTHEILYSDLTLEEANELEENAMIPPSQTEPEPRN